MIEDELQSWIDNCAADCVIVEDPNGEYCYVGRNEDLGIKSVIYDPIEASKEAMKNKEKYFVYYDHFHDGDGTTTTHLRSFDTSEEAIRIVNLRGGTIIKGVEMKVEKTTSYNLIVK